MSFTKRTTLTESWQALTVAGAKGLAQIPGEGAIRLHLGQSLPSNDTADFVVIWDDGLPEFPFYQAEAGDILYGRAADGSSVDIVVTATGSSP